MKQHQELTQSEVILGTMIGSMEGRKFVVNESGIDTELFTEDWHRVLYHTISELFRVEPEFSIQTLQGKLEVHPTFRNDQQPSIVHQIQHAFDPKRLESAIRLLHMQHTYGTLSKHLEDLSFAIASGISDEDIGARIIEQAKSLSRRDTSKQLNIVEVDKVETEFVEWLWTETIPLGMVTILDGDPGLGKSTLTAYMAAQVSMGLPLYGDTVASKPGRVLLISPEDSLASVIRPRLEFAGADLTRVSFLDSVTDNGEPRPIIFPDDFVLIQAEVDKNKPTLIVIDPLMETLSGRINSHNDQDIRRVMGGLRRLAESCGAAVICVRHLNKSGEGNALYRGGGSIGIIGSARMGLLVAKHPEDEHVRVLAATKSNLGVFPKSRTFELVSEEERNVPTVRWLGESDVAANELVREPVALPSAVDEAEEFIKNSLADGPVPAAEIEEAREHAGISSGSLRKAKKKLGVKSQRVGTSQSWAWSLGQDDQDDQPDPAP